MDNEPQGDLPSERKFHLRKGAHAALGSKANQKPQHKKLRCHYCRTMDMDKTYVICSNYPKCRCGFCFDCLRDHFKLNPKKILQNWICVVCHGACRCERCVERAKVAPERKAPEKVKTLEVSKDVVVVKEWRKDSYLTKETVYHGPKEYDCEDEEDGSGSDYVPGKRTSRRVNKVSAPKFKRKALENPPKKDRQRESTPIHEEKKAEINMPQIAAPSPYMYPSYAFSLPQTTEPGKAEPLIQSPRVSSYYPLVFPGMDCGNMRQPQYIIMDPTGQGYIPYLGANCFNALNPIQPEQFAPAYGWQNPGNMRSIPQQEQAEEADKESIKKVRKI